MIKLSPQQRKIVALLMRKDKDGNYKPAHMRDLNAICYRYPSRMEELRNKKGFGIETRNLGGSEREYLLLRIPHDVELPEIPAPRPEPAQGEMFHVEQHGDSTFVKPREVES